MQKVYSAAILRDEEAGVWYVSETDFPGLVAEAETQQELLQKIRGLIPELSAANRHLMRTARRTKRASLWAATLRTRP